MVKETASKKPTNRTIHQQFKNPSITVDFFILKKIHSTLVELNFISTFVE